MWFFQLGLGKARQLFMLKEAEEDYRLQEANLLLASRNGWCPKEDAQSVPALIIGVHGPQKSEQ